MRTRLSRSPASKSGVERPSSVSPLTATPAGRARNTGQEHAAFDFGRVSVLDQTLGSAAGGEVPHRAEMESAFGEDFSSVRAMTGRASELDRLGGGAAASGETVAFASERPTRRLVAHELAHVVQQRRRHRTGDAIAARGSPAELDAERAASAVVHGNRASVTAAAGGALALAPKNPFDDPKASASSADAAVAMKAYQALPAADRKAVVEASYNTTLANVLNSLSSTDQVQTFVDSLREIARWVEEAETRKSSGKTDDQIAAEQAKFMAKQAADDAKAAADAAAKKKGVAPVAPTAAEIEQARKDAVAKTSIAKSAATWWGGLSAADKGNWITRGNKAVDTVVKHAKANHPELKITAANFNLDFPKTEARGQNVVAAGSPALVGKAFVESVELNPAYVMDVVVHEIFGHPEYGTYGTEYHLALYDQAQAKIAGYVKPAAGTPDRTTELDAFAYQETEIYAVLRSSSYRTAPTAKDAPKVPNLDTQGLVDWHVGKIKDQWAPTLVVAILRGLRKRLRVDPRITQAALTMFDNAVLKNFDKKTQADVWVK